MIADSDDIGLREGASFQAKIASVALITTAVVLLTACIAFVVQQYGAETRALAAQNQNLAVILADHLGEEIAEGDPDEATEIAASLVKVPGVSAAYLIDSNGALIASSSAPDARNDRAPDPSQVEGVVRAKLHDRRGMVHGELVLVPNVGRLTPIIAKYLAVSFTLFFAATGLAMFMSKWLAARLIRPVNALADAMSGLAESGDFSQRAPVVGDPVFARLSESFNELMVQLQANDTALRDTLRDLTDARDAAETANVLKSQFLANMSHEIRTPLNGVLAMAQVMEMSQLDPRQRERLSVIRNSGEALLTVLNDVLDLSKIEAGRMELDVSDFDAAEVARSVALNFVPLATEKNLSLQLNVAPSAEGLRRGDAARMRQILTNLTSNAIKFTAEGTVTLAIVGLGGDGADRLALEVRDTGMGIAAEKLPTLFDKFTQVDSSATRRFGGTGLGLAICRELATLMGGQIMVETTVGEGSTFRVELPFPRVADVAPVTSYAEAASEREDEDRPVRILAAEDNLTNQRVLRAVLDTFGVDLTIVENGRAAVEAWREGGWDVVLMDIQMPEMDGVEAARAIRAEERARALPRTPILALSANAMTHQVSEYLAAGMDAHLAKPIEIPKLQAALEAALAGAQPPAVAA